MEKLLHELLKAARNILYLECCADNHSNNFIQKFAFEFQEIYEKALNFQKNEIAVAVALCADLIFIQHGKKYEALASNPNYCRILYTSTDDVEAYEGLREIFLQAEEMKANDLAFLTATLAAGSVFSASKSESCSTKKNFWLLKALENLIIASDKVKNCTNPFWFQGFVSTLSLTLHEVGSRVWFDGEKAKVQKLLCKLAIAAEALIPVEFCCLGDISKTNWFSRLLADLSYKYGDSAIGNARLSFAAQCAKETGDIEAWTETDFSRYLWARCSDAPHSQLVELRRSLRRRGEQLRLQFRSRAGRLWAAQKLDHIFGELLMDEFKETGSDISELFEAVEATKTRVLLDQMGTSILDFPSTELSSQAAEMERQMLSFGSENRWHLLTSEMKYASRLPIGTYWDEGERKQMLRSIEDFHAAHQAGFQKVAPISSLSEVMSALQPHEALIEYYIPYHRLHPAKELWILVVTSQETQVVPVSIDDLPENGMSGSISRDSMQPVDFSPLGNIVPRLRKKIRQQNPDDEAACKLLKNLSEKLVSPLLEWIQPDKFERWVIIPHRFLHSVPFAALLCPDGTYLIEDVALTISPSASIWYRLQRHQTQPVKSFVGFVNPVLSYMDGLNPLPDAEKGLARIHGSLKSLQFTYYKGEEATEANLRSQVKGKSIVHLATHGDFPQENAIDFHRILLSATSEHDGSVTAEEVRRMNFHSAWLVVLNICNGGLYRSGPGDEPYGLFPAFLAAGAENILGTLWPIEDDIGRFFIVEFYKHLLQCGPAEALRRACKQFIKDRALLRHWAGFVLVGPGRP